MLQNLTYYYLRAYCAEMSLNNYWKKTHQRSESVKTGSSTGVPQECQTFRTIDYSYHRRFVPLVDFSYHGRFVPLTFRTIRGLFVPFVP